MSEFCGPLSEVRQPRRSFAAFFDGLRAARLAGCPPEAPAAAGSPVTAAARAAKGDGIDAQARSVRQGAGRSEDRIAWAGRRGLGCQPFRQRGALLVATELGQPVRVAGRLPRPRAGQGKKRKRARYVPSWRTSGDWSSRRRSSGTSAAGPLRELPAACAPCGRSVGGSAWLCASGGSRPLEPRLGVRPQERYLRRHLLLEFGEALFLKHPPQCVASCRDGFGCLSLPPRRRARTPSSIRRSRHRAASGAPRSGRRVPPW